MDDNHNNDLPPFPTPPPPNSGHPPILPQPPPFGLLSTTPQSIFFTNPFYEQINPSNFPPNFIPYGYPIIDPIDDGRRVFDAWNTKVARTKRRLARQRSLTLSKASSSSSGGCNNDEHSKPSTTVTHCPNTTVSQSNKSKTQNQFTFCTPDEKVLRVLLKKELKNSDVGSLGRIVLPKREAEENLPLLTDKEGLQIVMRDVKFPDRKWAMKYKYWINNRSRMYVLENTGEFVKQNRLLNGDIMTLYEDEDNNIYVNIDKGDNHSFIEEAYKMRNNNQYSASTASAVYTNMNIKEEEEEASLAILIEELKHKPENDEPPPGCCNNNLLVSDTYFESGISRGSYTSNTQQMASSSSSSHIMGAARGSNIHQAKQVEVDLQAMNNGFEDCFGGLDTLPEVSGFDFHPFDYLNNDKTL